MRVRHLGVKSHAGIANVCRGKPIPKKRPNGTVVMITPKSYKGFKWRYTNE